MEVSKFKIGNNIIDVKDAKARDDVVAAMNAAQDAQSTADLKQDAATAWKCGYITRTFYNITIATGSTYDFAFNIPDGVTNAIPVYARSSDSIRPLFPVSLFTSDNQFHNNMYNAGASISNATITIQIACMFN